MDPKLQQALADILKSLTDAANHVGTVAKEQLPLLVQEYLRWGIVSGFMSLAMCGLAIGAVVYARPRLARVEEESMGDATMTTFFTTIVVLVLFGFAVASAFDVVQIWIAPRVYLLETVSRLIK